MNAMWRKLALIWMLVLSTPVMAEQESWYFHWNIGTANHIYPGVLDEVMDYLESFPEINRTELAMDMLGFYFPMSDTTTMGVIISGSGDMLVDSYTNEIVQYNHYIYGISGMEFFGNEIGDGPFIRGDVGASRMIISFVAPGFNESIVTDWGLGGLIGAGYGWPLSKSTRLLFTASYSLRRIMGEDYSTVGFTVGGLW